MIKKLTTILLILVLGVGFSASLTTPVSAAEAPQEEGEATSSWIETLLSILGMDDPAEEESETCEEEECDRGGYIDP